MEQFQLASAIFLKEFLKIVDFQNLNINSIDEHIEQLKAQILLNLESDEFQKQEQNYNNPIIEFREQENHSQQKTKKKQQNKMKSNGNKYFYCSKCNKKFNHPSSLSRHKKNQHKSIKQDMFDVKQQSQQQEVIINLTDLEI